MQWFEIQINLPLFLLESTYNFLWPFIHSIEVERREKDFLKEIVSSLVQRLSPQGFIVLGGMTIAQIEPVLSVFTHYGLQEYRRYSDEEWGVVVLQR